jgi:UDPglucose 6-dehydrogenase
MHAASMAVLGHEVVGVDVDRAKVDRAKVNRAKVDRDKVDRDKVDRLSKAKAPFYEPDFEALLERTLATGRRSSSADMAAAEGSRVHFVLVGTPQKR